MGSKKTRNAETPRLAIPVYIPTEDGVGELELGNAEVRGSTLIINFNDLIPSEAIRRRIEQGYLTGVTFVIPEDEAAAAKEREDEIQRHQDEARAHQEMLENETPEEKLARELREEEEAKIDQELLEEELSRLEE